MLEKIDRVVESIEAFRFFARIEKPDQGVRAVGNGGRNLDCARQQDPRAWPDAFPVSAAPAANPA